MEEPQNTEGTRNPSTGANQQKDLANNPNYTTPSNHADITDSAAEDGSSDGIANKTKGSGSNTDGPGGSTSTRSNNNEGQLGGGESQRKDQRSPSHQTEHGAHASKGQGGSAGGGNGGREGSMSGSSGDKGNG